MIQAFATRLFGERLLVQSEESARTPDRIVSREARVLAARKACPRPLRPGAHSRR